jgi:hypothetical protein
VLLGGAAEGEGLTEHWLRVLENMVLRRILGLTGDWRRLHFEELYSLYASPNIIRVIKSRRIRWAGHVARTEKRGVYRVLVGKPEGKRHLVDLGIDKKIILKLIFKKQHGGIDGIDLTQIGTGDGLL